MTQHKHGGPAYPIPATETHDTWPGMSLRDAAALAALPALIARHRADVPWAHVAPMAYAIADALVQARDTSTKPSQPQTPQRGDIYIDPLGMSGTWIVWHTDPNDASELIPIRDDFRLHITRVATRDLRNPARDKPLRTESAK